VDRQPTIYSIARELGIHPSTVSRAFSRPDLVRPEMRERVLQKAEELGYSPNAVARGLITGKTGMVGLLIPDIDNPFFPPAIHAIQSALAAHDLAVMLINSDLAHNAEPALIQRVRSQLDGLVLMSPRTEPTALVPAARGLPLVLVNVVADGSFSVTIDSDTALLEALGYLRGLGHTEFVLLGGPAASWLAQQRRHRIGEWAAATGIGLRELGPYEAGFEDGLTAARDVAALSATAVLAFDDVMAAGLLAGLSKLEVRVPADVSIVGCDDVLLAKMTAPALTTVAAPFAELGTVVAQGLWDQISGRSRPESVRLQGRLVIRESTGPRH
jgi:LacI family transcriptional regulator